MEEFSEIRNATRYEGDKHRQIEKQLVREFPLTIILNNTQLVTMLCSPGKLKELAIGFLVSEGFIKTQQELKNILVDTVTGVARVYTRNGREVSSETLSKRVISTGCGRGAAFYSSADIGNATVDSNVSIKPDEIYELARIFQLQSTIYRKTHGVHSAALGKNATIAVFAEDIGRHNAVDKVIGHCFMNGISPQDAALIVSGRVSSEIAHKIVKQGIPILVSISVPTQLAVEACESMGVTLITSVRGNKLDVYTHAYRIESAASD